jgi:hypothetical protein
MSHDSDAMTLTLLGLRLKGFGGPDAIAELTGLDEATVQAQLEKAAADELVMHREGGAISGWAILPPGRTLGEELLGAELDKVGGRDTVQAAYEDFLHLNRQMLQLCTDWQVVKGADGGETINQHDDADYDAAVIGRLKALHEDLVPILEELTGLLPRYGPYEPRFESALERLDAGELEYFTKPLIASYHTVWFELHEDLLATLGIDRASESEGE